MIKINKKDGKTISFDLNEENDKEKITELLGNKDFLGTITGLSSLHNTYWHALTKPKKFRSVSYHVESVKYKKGDVEKIIGEKIICQADDIQLTILVYYNQRPKMTRIELKRIGKRRFIPNKNEVMDGISNKESR